MTEKGETELDELQKLVLVGIGRNVLNLQKMEGVLKSLVLMVNIEAPLEGSEAAVRKRKQLVARMPLGHLVEEFARLVRPNVTKSEQKLPTVASWITSFRFDDDSYVHELRSTLRDVVKERNNLIHKQLLAFDPNSSESCRIFASELEDQRQRIQPKFEELAAIWTAVTVHIKEMREYYESGQFEKDWQAAQNDLMEVRH